MACQNGSLAWGAWLTNAPGIFGAASAYRSAKQLGHSVAIAEKCYLGLLRGIPREARTLDEAMGINDLLDEIVAQAGGARRPPHAESASA